MPATTAQPAPVKRGRPSTGARERILEAAIEVLKADGYAGLTIAKVATTAGESKPLVAYHYGSKQGLVEACARSVAEIVTAAVLDAVEVGSTVEEVIRSVLDGVDELLERDARLARLYFDLASVSVVEPEVRRSVNEVNESWRTTLTRLLTEADDAPAPAAARSLALMVTACSQGLALERIERGATREWKRARELFLQGAIAAAQS